METTKELAAANRQSPLDQDRGLDGAWAPAGVTAQNVGQNCLSTASLALLAAAIGQIGEAIVITDTSATIQYVNPAFARITGYSAEEAVGQNTRFLKSDRQDSAFYRELWKTILSGEAWQGELTNRRKDGSLYTEEMSITPVRGPSGAITNFIAIKQDVSEGRATQAALHSSEKRLEEVQHIAPLGSWELDEPASEFRGSIGFFRIFDWTPRTSALPFDKVMDAIPACDRERINQTLKNSLRTHEPFDVEHRVVRRDGTMLVVRSRGQVVASPESGSVRLVGTTLDITDGKLAHEKLRQSEENFRSLVANIPDVTWSSAVDGQTRYISPNVERVFGFTSEEICEAGTELWLGRIYPSDSKRITEAFHRLFAEGQPFDVEYRIQRKDGLWIWVHDRAYRTYEKDGVRYADGVFSDVTGRKRAEQELRLAQFSLEHAAGAIEWTDSQAHIVYVNQATCHSLGFSREELLSLSIADIDPLLPKEAWAAFWDKLKNRGSMTFETQHQTKQGRLFPVEITSNYFAFDGQEYGFAFVRDISERKRAEEALRESERFLQSTLNALSSHVAILDENGEIVAVNAAWHRFTAANGGDVGACGVGNNYLEVCRRASPSSAEANSAAAGIRQAIAGSLDEFSLEYPCHGPEQQRWFLMRVTPFGDDGPGRVVLAHENITNRKLAEEAVRESERRYRLLFERNLAGVFRHTAEGRILDANDACAHILGYSSGKELAGLRRSDLFFDSGDAERTWARLQGKKALTGLEVRLRRKDGTAVWILENVSWVESGAGTAPVVEGTCIDITERKRAEEVRERLVAVIDSCDDAIIGKTLDGTITAWNAGAEKLFGYSSFEALGGPMRMLLPPECAIEESDILVRIGRGERVDHFETVRARKDGKNIDVSVTISPIKDSSGAIIGASNIVRDISDRKRADQEMRKAKEAAEAANRAKSQFLANMSHEIRTPMNGVIGAAGLLLDTELTPEQRQYAEIVRSSGEALLAVINDILDFSKIEARKLTLETTDFDLRTVLEDAAAVLAIKASEKGLELTCELEPGTPWLLRGDPGRVRQVLVNLLGNAVKFTAQGEVAVGVRLEAKEEGMARLRFTVRDTGIGFGQDRASALFEPFVQADGSSTRRYGGTGLGLTISKQLVEMMGGQIGVESGKGKGSTFWFTTVFEKQPRPGATVTGVHPSLRNAKVLVVDDSATNRSLVCRLLNSWGCRPEESADGNLALAILRQAAQSVEPFQIALLDMSLPGMDGEELGRQIVADPQLKHTALVLMTGFGRQSNLARLQALGIKGYVSKPIWERTLREALLALGAMGSGAAAPAKRVVQPPSAVRANREARILLAEDNLTNQAVAVAMLNRLGYSADLVANGVEALQALRQADYDLVLMDCEMPEMDGYEATRRIRERGTGTRDPHIPIVAITADAMTGDRDKCLQAGMSDYLAKPVEPRQLAEVLQKWLNPPASGEVSPPPGQSPAKTEAVFNQAIFNQAIFNQADLLARLMGDKVLAGKVVAGFLNDVPQQLRTLRYRLEKGDADGARLQAHTLKGAAATVSAQALQALCCEAQEAAASRELSSALALLPRLDEQFELLKTTLKQSGWA